MPAPPPRMTAARESGGGEREEGEASERSAGEEQELAAIGATFLSSPLRVAALDAYFHSTSRLWRPRARSEYGAKPRVAWPPPRAPPQRGAATTKKLRALPAAASPFLSPLLSLLLTRHAGGNAPPHRRLQSRLLNDGDGGPAGRAAAVGVECGGERMEGEGDRRSGLDASRPSRISPARRPRPAVQRIPAPPRHD